MHEQTFSILRLGLNPADHVKNFRSMVIVCPKTGGVKFSDNTPGAEYNTDDEGPWIISPNPKREFGENEFRPGDFWDDAKV